ncbi:MAG: hypothetical protein U1D55_07240 [Phycisphaerae bacterium]
MRNLLRFVVIAGLVATIANAGVVFDYNGVAYSTAPGVSTYMTNVYGSPVTVTGAYASNNTLPAPNPGVLWTGNASDYLRVGPGAPPVPGTGDKDFEISFDQIPIQGISLLGYIFDEARGPTDFQIYAYDSTYTDRENPSPSALVFHQAFDVTANGTQVFVGTPQFSRPVSLLVFSDHGSFDVGIDDMTITVPEPSAALGLLGLPLLALRRRILS